MPKPHDGRPEQQGAWPWAIKIRFSRRQQNANLGTKGSLPAPSRRAAETCLVDQEQVAKPRDERATDVQSGHRQQAPRLRCRCVKGRGHSLDTWCARANSKGVI